MDVLYRLSYEGVGTQRSGGHRCCRMRMMLADRASERAPEQAVVRVVLGGGSRI
jgi:hypothetical protein